MLMSAVLLLQIKTQHPYYIYLLKKKASHDFSFKIASFSLPNDTHKMSETKPQPGVKIVVDSGCLGGGFGVVTTPEERDSV